MKAGARPGGTPGAPAGQPGTDGESVLSKILPGGAAEQAGKLTEGMHCLQPGPWRAAAPGPSSDGSRVWEMIPGSVSQSQASLKVYLLLSSGTLGGPCPLGWAWLHCTKCPQLGGSLVQFPDACLLFLCHSCLCFWQKVLLILVTMPCRVSMSCLYPASLCVGVLRGPLGGVRSLEVGDVARAAVSSPVSVGGGGGKGGTQLLEALTWGQLSRGPGKGKRGPALPCPSPPPILPLPGLSQP